MFFFYKGLTDHLNGNGICIVERSNIFGGGSFEEKSISILFIYIKYILQIKIIRKYIS